MSDDVKPAKATETDQIHNSEVLPGLYREVATGDTVNVTRVGDGFVVFHYATRGIQSDITLPHSDFSLFGRFARVD